MQCPCQSGATYRDCCEPFIRGIKQAETAEQLMRARYAAHTQIEMDFIEKTHDPQSKQEINREETREWAESTNWQGLEIIETKKGGAGDDVGLIEFKATYEADDGLKVHHELSEFHKRDGVWYYTDSMHPIQTVVRESPKIGRNEPCACGSGKKYKKCCGAN